MTNINEDRASDLATMLALTELVRLALSELCFTADRKEFSRRIEVLERTAVDGLTSRKIFPGANEATETHIKEQAALFVTTVMTSIRHPADDTGGAPA